MKISIILPAFNEAALLPGTLASIHRARPAFHTAGWDSEVIVCDNNSTDGTGAIAEAHGARVVFEPVNMIARARNTGASVATGDWLLFVDADSQPPPALFASVVRAVSSGRVMGGGSTVILDADDFRARLGSLVWNSVSRIKRVMAGSFIFVEATAFREIGGFSGRFYAAEEIDFTRRLKPVARRAGKKIVILSDAPLVTSARKFRLYKPREMARLFLGAVFRPKATLTNKEACHLWYDGRR